MILSIFDHAAKVNQSKYPWSQNVVSIGLIKMVKGRWACLPLAFRFYHMKKDIDENIHTKTGPVLMCPLFHMPIARSLLAMGCHHIQQGFTA